MAAMQPTSWEFFKKISKSKIMKENMRETWNWNVTIWICTKAETNAQQMLSTLETGDRCLYVSFFNNVVNSLTDTVDMSMSSEYII